MTSLNSKVSIILIFLLLNSVSVWAVEPIKLYSPENSKEISLLIDDFSINLSKSIGYIPQRIKSYDRNTNLIIIQKKYSGFKDLDYSDLGEDGFIIKNLKSNQVVISAQSNWGLELGMYYFLEKFLGFIWLFPGEEWTVIPQVNSFSVPLVNVVEKPSFITRRLSPINTGVPNELGRWGRHLRLRQDVEYGHSLYKIFANTTKFAPKVRGVRKLPKSKTDQSWQPNFNASGVDTYSTNFLIRYFKTHPEENSISLGINDSRNFDDSNYSGRNNHLGLKDYSESYYSWIRKVVTQTNKVYPDKKYGLLAYNNVASPPSFKLPSNVVPFITYERLRWLDKKERIKDVNALSLWKTKVNNIGWYDYVYGASYIVPRPYFSHMKEYLIFANNNNVNHYVAEIYTNVLEGPKAWLLSQLLWDVNQNVNDLSMDWYEAAVGKESAVCLRDFYGIWEQFWTKDIVGTKWWNLEGTAYLHFHNMDYIKHIPVEYMDKSDSLLRQALNNTTEPEHRKRIIAILELWQLSKLNYVYFTKNDLKSLKSSAVTKKDIFNKMEELSNTEMNRSFIKMQKKYNKY